MDSDPTVELNVVLSMHYFEYTRLDRWSVLGNLHIHMHISCGLDQRF